MLKPPGFEGLFYKKDMVNSVELTPAMEEINSPKSNELTCGQDVEVKGSTMIWDPGEKLITAQSLEKGFIRAKAMCTTYEDPMQCELVRITTVPMEMETDVLEVDQLHDPGGTVMLLKLWWTLLHRRLPRLMQRKARKCSVRWRTWLPC